MRKKKTGIKDNFGASKEDISRGYKDGMYRPEPKEDDWPEPEAPVGGFCERPLGWER